MNRIKKLIPILLCFLLIFTMTGCKGKSPVGTYKLVNMSDAEAEDYSDTIKTMEDLGLTITIEFKEDKTGVFTIYGVDTNFTWDDKAITVNDVSETYELKGDTLTLQESEAKLIFERVVEETK